MKISQNISKISENGIFGKRKFDISCSVLPKGTFIFRCPKVFPTKFEKLSESFSAELFSAESFRC